MIYLRSLLVGVVTALGAAILWIVAAVVLPLLVSLLRARFGGDGTGSGGIGFVSVDSGSALAAALVGFVAGVWWTLRRRSRKSAR